MCYLELLNTSSVFISKKTPFDSNFFSKLSRKNPHLEGYVPKNALWGVFANKKYKDFFSNSKQHMVVFCKKKKKTHKYSTITFISRKLIFQKP